MTDSTGMDARNVEESLVQTAPIAALPQFLIDSIASHLDLKTLVHLQMTCRDLYSKCLNAQRLKEVHFSQITVSWNNDQDKIPTLTLGTPWEPSELIVSERQLKAMKFRFLADELLFQDSFDDAAINKAGECLFGRGTVEKLQVNALDIDERADPAPFERLIQELKISNLRSFGIPMEFWQRPSVKQMTGVQLWGELPLHLDYLVDTAFENCYILECAENENDCHALNSVLKKWAEGQRVIEYWDISFHQFREGEFFKDFLVLAEKDVQPQGRPVAVRATFPVGECGYTVERSDGQILYVEYYNFGKLKLSDTPIEASEMDSNMERQMGDEVDYGSGDEDDFDDFSYGSDGSFDDMEDI